MGLRFSLCLCGEYVKLIVGLGNPGDDYEFTPHNFGFRVVDRIANEYRVELRNRQCRALTARVTIGSETVLLAKPETFMNLSGTSVRELVAKHDVRPEEDLIVIQDELDFPLGTIRIQRKRSSAGHNGIESIISSLGTNDFLRIRMGVAPDRRVEDGMSYLLLPFRKAQLKVVDEMLEVAADSVKTIVTEGAAAAMNRFNRKVDTEEKD
jgi:peptidyl-tRNA hydrolase, PTH1 family